MLRTCILSGVTGAAGSSVEGPPSEVSCSNAPEEHIDLAILLRDENSVGVQAIHSRGCPKQQVVAVSTDRLHTIAGECKDNYDPVATVRTQDIFPAPEEAVSPNMTAYYVAGDARGSHQMPVAINTVVAGA